MVSLPTQFSPRPQIYVAFCSKDSGPDGPKFSNLLARYDLSNNTWSHVSSNPGLVENHVLKDFSMMSIGDCIYIIGGRVYRKEKNIEDSFGGSNDYIDVEVEVLSNVLCYNVNSDQWSNCAPLSMPRCNFACTVLDDKIYVAGGQYEASSARSTSSVEMYDPSTNKWTQLPNMRRLRYKCVGVTWQGKVYVVGGFVERCDLEQLMYSAERCSAEVYNEQESQWELVSGMWQLDVPPNQIMEVEGKLFSSGDCLNAWKGHIEVFDEKFNMWNEVEGSRVKSLCQLIGNRENSKPVRKLCVTMVPIGYYLYFLTGYTFFGDGSSYSTGSIVHRFDTTAKENAWMSFEPSREEGEREISSHCCVVTH